MTMVRFIVAAALALTFAQPVAARDRVKEGLCADSTVRDVENRAADDPIPTKVLAAIERSVVRIRVTTEQRARELFKAMPAARRADPGSFSLGSFSAYAGDNRGICTGTLIDGNVVLTAGHCVWVNFWMQEHDNGDMSVPYYTIRGEPHALSAADLVKFFVVDFNYEADYSATASASGLGPLPIRTALPFTVTALLDTDKDEKIDFAILHINGAREQIGGYALGAARLDFGTPRFGGRVAVIQHYGGYTKKIAYGHVETYDSERQVLHTASTEQGSSGSPIFNSEGKLVGVHTDGGCEDQRYQTNLGVTLKSLKSRLKKQL